MPFKSIGMDHVIADFLGKTLTFIGKLFGTLQELLHSSLSPWSSHPLAALS